MRSSCFDRLRTSGCCGDGNNLLLHVVRFHNVICRTIFAHSNPKQGTAAWEAREWLRRGRAEVNGEVSIRLVMIRYAGNIAAPAFRLP